METPAPRLLLLAGMEALIRGWSAQAARLTFTRDGRNTRWEPAFEDERMEMARIAGELLAEAIEHPGRYPELGERSAELSDALPGDPTLKQVDLLRRVSMYAEVARLGQPILLESQDFTDTEKYRVTHRWNADCVHELLRSTELTTGLSHIELGDLTAIYVATLPALMARPPAELRFR